MHRLLHDLSPPTPQSAATPVAMLAGPGIAMTTEHRTKRRWMLSVLAAVAALPEGPDRARVFERHARRQAMQTPGQKHFTSRLKAVTRPLAEASA
jgi:hypothetical protein